MKSRFAPGPEQPLLICKLNPKSRCMVWETQASRQRKQSLLNQFHFLWKSGQKRRVGVAGEGRVSGLGTSKTAFLRAFSFYLPHTGFRR